MCNVLLGNQSVPNTSQDNTEMYFNYVTYISIKIKYFIIKITIRKQKVAVFNRKQLYQQKTHVMSINT